MDEQIVKTEKGARQGGKGSRVLYVLVGSLVLLGLYMVGLMTWSSRQGPDYATKSESSSAQVTGSTTGRSDPATSANTGNVPPANPAYPAPATRDANAPAK